MARISPDEANQLASVSYKKRVQILYGYLVKNMNQKDLAEYVYGDYGDWASMRISLVTRGYGFHQGRSRGKYASVPQYVIEEFVQEYDAENYNGGLNEGTFDDFLSDYRQQLAQQQQREAQQRQREKEAAERRAKEEALQRERLRLQQIEDERRQREWALQQEKLRRQQEEERRAREEAERLERLRREQEAREKEERRKAAVARGDHERLMNEGFAALEQHNYTLARSKAEQAWELNPMIGLQYIFAFCAAGQGDRSGAVKWAGDALERYQEGEKKYLDLCVLYLNNGGVNRAIHYGQQLHAHGGLSRLNDKGLAHLGARAYKATFRMEGGLRLSNKSKTRDGAYMQFAEDLSLLIANRIPTDSANRTLLLDCAYILTRRKHYRAALEIYHQYENGDCFSMDSPAYDLRAHKGFCYYGLGDNSSALLTWYPELMYHPHYDTIPLDVFWAYSYDKVLLELTKNNPEVQEHMDFTHRYVDGDIPGSVYFGRYFGDWRSRLGLAPNEDTRWYCDDDDLWHVEAFTLRPADTLKEQAKGFFGKLFGR